MAVLFFGVKQKNVMKNSDHNSNQDPFLSILAAINHSKESGEVVQFRKLKDKILTDWIPTRVLIFTPEFDQVWVQEFRIIKLSEIADARIRNASSNEEDHR